MTDDTVFPPNRAAVRHRLRRMAKFALLTVACALAGLATPALCAQILPGIGAVVAASFIVNSALLAMTLALLPDEPRIQTWSHLRCLAFNAALACAAYLGLFLYGVRFGSPRVMFALALLSCAQMSVLAALNAVLSVPFKARSRLPRAICGLALAISVTALLWTRAPILNAGSPARSSFLISAVMRASPPAAVGAAWYSESDAGLGAESGAQRFDLIRAPMTYAVWIGSYDAVEYPVILPRWSGTGPQARFELGLGVLLLMGALPVLLACDWLQRRRRFT